MLNVIWSLISICIIILILLKVPNNTGLESIVTKSNFLGSPSSTEKFITILTWVCIFVYFSLSLKFNLIN